MGLDYLIYLAVRDKETKVNKHIIEIAYWRKGWAIRDELNAIASKPIYSLPDMYDKSDVWHTCSPAVLQSVINLFKDNLNDIMCDYGLTLHLRHSQQEITQYDSWQISMPQNTGFLMLKMKMLSNICIMNQKTYQWKHLMMCVKTEISTKL